MALPTITHNSPVAGSIAWTSFGIQYNGQSFNIPAGNSNQAFVWWLYNGGTAPALQQGNTLPTLGPDDMILFLNKAGTGVLVPTAELQDGSLIVGGSILAQAIGANQIQTTHLQANAVTADQIAANSIVSKHVSAGTITADKLSVGTVSDNMVVNGSFEDALSGTLVGWEINAMTNGTITPVTGVASSGAVSMQMMATTTAANLRFRQLPEQFMPVSAASGRKYYIAVRAGSTVTTTTGLYIRVNWYDGNKALLAGAVDIRSNGAITTTFTIYEGQATPPATAKYMGIEILLTNLNVVTTAYIDEVIAHEVTMSAQIGDGQITAAKIVANSITADRIQTAAITADKLLVADRSNYWENPDFEIDTVGQAPKGLTSTSTTNARVIAGGSQGSGKAWELNALNGVNNDHYSTNTFPVEPGDQYYVRMDYKFLNAAGTANAGIGFRTYGPTKAAVSHLGVALSGSARPLTWTTHPGAIYTVPAGVYFLQPWVTFSNNAETTNRFHVDDIIIRRMSGGELIVDGAIIAAKIATDAVTSEKIIANAISAKHIQAATITADKMIISRGANLFADPEIRDASAWNIGSFIQATGGRSAGGSVLITQSATQLGTYYGMAAADSPKRARLLPGGTYRVSGYVKTSAAAPAFSQSIYLRHQLEGSATSTGLLGPIMNQTATVADTWTLVSGHLKLPDNTLFTTGVLGVYKEPNYTTGTSTWSDLAIQEVAGGELIVDGAVIASKIATGAVIADKIAANVITANKLAVGDFENLATINEVNGTTIATNGQTQIVGGYNTKVSDADPFFMFKERGGPVPFKPGEKILVQFTAKATTATTVIPTIWVYDAASVNLASSAPATSVGTTDTEVSVIITAGTPTNPSKEWVIGISGAAGKGVAVKNVVVRRMTSGVLIQDGAITADKISVNALDGKTITGATVQTAATGARIVMNTTSLKGWDAAGINYLTADSTGLSVTGTVSAVGQSKTWLTNQNVNIKATLGNKTARNTWMDYDFLQPGVYFENSVAGQNVITMPRLIAPYNDTMQMASANLPVDASGDLNVMHQSTVSAAPYGASFGSKRYDKRLNEDGNDGIAGILTSGSIATAPDAITAVVEEGAADKGRVYGISIGGTNTLGPGYGTGAYPAYPGVEMSVKSGPTDPVVTTSAVKVAKDGAFEISSGTAAGSTSILTAGDGNLLVAASNVLTLGANAITATGVVDAASYKVGGVAMGAAESVTLQGGGTLVHNTLTTLNSWQIKNDQSTSPNMVTFNFSTGEITAIQTGVYDISVHFAINGIFNGRSFVEIAAESQSYGGSRNNLAVNEDSGTTVLMGVKLTAGDKFKARAYGSVDSTKVTGYTMRVVKRAAPLPIAGWESGNLTHEGTVTVNGVLTAKHRRAEYTNVFEVLGNNNWDTGATVMDTSGPARTTDTAMTSPGPYPGSIKFNEAGYYTVSLFTVPRSNPGVGWTRLSHSSSERLTQASNTSVMWETYCQTVPVYYAAGEHVRSLNFYPNTHVIDVRWKVIKVST